MKKTDRNRQCGEKKDAVELPTGKLKYPLTNDFMFKAVLQRNQTALKGLLCALLQMEMEEIVAIRILNPIEIGGVIDEKMMMLDLKLELNDSRILDIEMQVFDEGNWPERSLSYLCRAFDQLEKGEKYLKTKETIHIGIIDFTPKNFPHRFYLDYFFYNLDTAHKYSDKVSIRVLQLNQLDNEADEKARMQSEAREDYYRRLSWAEERGLQKGIEKGVEQGLERGKKETARNLISNIEHAMESFHVGVESACEGLGTTVEAYHAAKKLLEIDCFAGQGTCKQAGIQV